MEVFMPNDTWDEKLSLNRSSDKITCDVAHGNAELPSISLKKIDPSLDDQHVTLFDSEKMEDNQVLLTVQEGLREIALFKEIDDKIVLFLSNSFVRKFNAQNPGILPAGTEKDDKIEFNIDRLKLSSSLNIEDIRIQGASTDLAIMFSALGCQVKNDKGQIGVVKNIDHPYDMYISSKFLNMAESLERGSKENSAISIERSSATDQLYVAQTKYQRASTNTPKEIVGMQIPDSSNPKIELLSVPKQTEESYINFRRDNNKKLFVYTQLFPREKESPATTYKYEQVTGISFQGSYKDGIPSQDNLQTLSVVLNLSNGKSIIAETFDMATQKAAAQKAVEQYQNIFDDQITAATKTPEAQSADANKLQIPNFAQEGQPLTIYPLNNSTLYNAKFDEVAQINRAVNEDNPNTTSSIISNNMNGSPTPNPGSDNDGQSGSVPINFEADGQTVENPQNDVQKPGDNLENNDGQSQNQQPLEESQSQSKGDQQNIENIFNIIPKKPKWNDYKSSETSIPLKYFLTIGLIAFAVLGAVFNPFFVLAAAAFGLSLLGQQTQAFKRFINFVKNVHAQRKWRREVNKTLYPVKSNYKNLKSTKNIFKKIGYSFANFFIFSFNNLLKRPFYFITGKNNAFRKKNIKTSSDNKKDQKRERATILKNRKKGYPEAFMENKEENKGNLQNVNNLFGENTPNSINQGKTNEEIASSATDQKGREPADQGRTR